MRQRSLVLASAALAALHVRDVRLYTQAVDRDAGEPARLGGGRAGPHRSDSGGDRDPEELRQESGDTPPNPILPKADSGAK